MLRRDYFMKMIQELAQALARVVHLKQRQEFSQALEEIDRSLARFWNLPPDATAQKSLAEWIALCLQEEQGIPEKLTALADLLRERGELCALREDPAQAQQSHSMALGLYLEAINAERTLVSADLLHKIEELAEVTRGGRLPVDVLKRLLAYYETRGMLARAEDALFDWLDSGDPDAPGAGFAFYGRLAARTDEDLLRGGLPRDEVEQGRQELLKRAGASVPLS